MTKRFTKLMAFALAASMIVAPTTVFAESGQASGNQAVSGNGDAYYVDTTIYDVVLPTTATLNFKMDPQGLLDLSDGTAATLASLSANAGLIRTSVSSAPSIINKSSMPISLTVSLNVAVKAKKDIVMSSVSQVNAGVSNNVVLYVVPSKDSISQASAYASSGKGILLTTAALSSEAAYDSIDFLLGSSTYTVSRNGATYTYKYSGGATGTGFQVGGYVNKNADWSAFDGSTPTKTLGIKAVFNFKKPVGTPATISGSGIYGLVSMNGLKQVSANVTALTYVAPPAPSTPSSNDLTATVKVGSASVDIPFTYPSGATSVSSVKLVWTDSKTYNNEFTVSTGKITLAGSGAMNTWYFGAEAAKDPNKYATTYTGTVTFNNNATKPLTLVVTK